MSGFMDFLNNMVTGKDLLENMDRYNLDDSIIAHHMEPVIPKIEIDSESPFSQQLQQQTNQILEKSNEQISLLSKQNEQLINNYQKLEELYKIKEQEQFEAKKDAKKAKAYNTIMLIIAIVSMLTAIAAWLLPNILGGAS